MNGYWIQTASGKHFDLENPTVEMVDINDIAVALSNLCRFTGHCGKFYSVAEHSIRVMNMLQPRFRLEGLLHDAAEAYIGDMSSPLKRFLRMHSDAVAEMIERVEVVVRKAFGLNPGQNLNVKAADARMLATEAKFFMAADDTTWGLSRPYDDFGWTPLLHPETARALFLKAYTELKDNPSP